MTPFISSYALSTNLMQSILTAQNNLAQAEQEVSTGTYADVGLTLGAQTSQDISLRSEQSLLETLNTTNNLVSTNLSTAQNALQTLQTTAQNLLKSLVGTSGDNGASDGAASVQQDAQSALQSLISELNTNVNGSYIFAGINTSVAPITDYYGAGAPNQSAVNTAFSSTFGFSQSSSNVSTITSSQMQSFLTNQFAPLFQGSNWTSDWSSASNTATTAEISPSQTVTTSVSANQPAFQELAQAYTMVAELGTQNLSSSAYQTLSSNAQSLINSALTGLTDLQSQLGTVQSAITAANSQMSVQMNVLSTQIGNLENVNTYQASTQVTDLQTQIETAYTLTSQLSQLSLVKYL
ncbi:MAG TPA: flagellar hook-associated family protein [Methylovirgula sp.]|nr:flagellar hook-associated family protein [Methylovirgula sp.]